nr:ORF70 [Acipenserid herpesvirus 1]
MLKRYNKKLISLKLKSQVQLKRYISKGSFNTVFKGIYSKQRHHVAIKFFDPTTNSDGVFEGAVLQRINHPNLVNVLHMSLTPNVGVIISPWCTIPLTEFDVPRLRVLVEQLWDGLCCLHSHSLAHMDVKPDNVLVDVTSNGSVLYKLTDFNLMHFLATRLTYWVGTQGFIAPEVLAASPEQPYLVSRTADFYSLGILAQEIYPHPLPPPWITRLISPTPSQRTLIQIN